VVLIPSSASPSNGAPPLLRAKTFRLSYNNTTPTPCTLSRANAMKLYIFGFSKPFLLPSVEYGTIDQCEAPRCILKAEAIQVLWSSWCDVVLAYQTSIGTWTTEYRGTGLTAVQKKHVSELEAFKTIASGTVAMTDFFGTEMHDGLRGYVTQDLDGTSTHIIIFATELEEDAGVPVIQSYAMSSCWKNVSVCMGGRGDVMLSMTSNLTSEEVTLRLEDLAELRERLESGALSSAVTPSIATFKRVQWCTNSTSAAALDSSGQVYTMTRDPRYPPCLGRLFTNTADFEPVPYLSETKIAKIASGGYLSAAVSLDGELFIWGQAPPGSEGSLSVLTQDTSMGAHSAEVAISRITADDEQDEMIKCLSVVIEGEVASVYDVAIGHGHIIIAAGVRTAETTRRRALFAAGVNDKGQMGLPAGLRYVAHFTEIFAMRDTMIERLVATGWTTFVVTTD
jgi:hypothetical protein